MLVGIWLLLVVSTKFLAALTRRPVFQTSVILRSKKEYGGVFAMAFTKTPVFSFSPQKDLFGTLQSKVCVYRPPRNSNIRLRSIAVHYSAGWQHSWRFKSNGNGREAPSFQEDATSINSALIVIWPVQSLHYRVSKLTVQPLSNKN